jgi:hemoglobin/transferrin/lactoferrin receptor protein
VFNLSFVIKNKAMKNVFLIFLIIHSWVISAQSLALDSKIFSRGNDTIQNGTQDSTLKEVVVTAFRTQTDIFKTPEAITIITNKHTTRLLARTTPELLFNQNGVFIQKTNHGGGSPFLRGLTGNQTLLLVDGIRLNNATFRYGPNQYFNTIDPFLLQKVEILRGSGSVAYGSDAQGGVIQVLSKNPLFSSKNRLNGHVLGKIMTGGMEETVHSDLSFSSKNVGVLGGISYRNFGDLIGGDTTGRQNPTGYKELNFDIKTKIKINNKAVLTLAHQNTTQDNVPVFHKVQLENFKINAFDPQRRQLSYARFDQDFDHTFLKKIYITASSQATEEGRKSQKNGSSILRIENDKVQSTGVTAQTEMAFSKDWTAVNGIEFYHDLVKSSRLDFDEKQNTNTPKRGLYPDASTLSSYAVYSLHNLKKDDWLFTFGGRFNTYNIGVKDENLGETMLKPSAFVWNASILRGWQNVSLFASFNTAFRAPNIDDLGTLGIVDFRYETPNFNLKPEKSYNTQVGFKYKSSKLQGETYLYRNELRDIIARIKVDTQKIQGYSLYKKENVEKGYIQGFETQWTYEILRGLSLESGLTYTFGENVTKAEPMRRIPPLNGRFALNFNQKTWSAMAEFMGATQQNRLAQGDRDDNRIPKNGTPAWWILNIYGSYNWQFLNFNIGLQNLFNQNYRTHGSGVNGVGRSASLSIEWHF